MSTQANKAVVRRWLESYNMAHASVIEALADETFTPDFIVHDAFGPGTAMGAAGAKRAVQRTFAKTPDFHITVEDIIAEGDTVMARVTLHHTDPSTGRPARFLGAISAHCAGGKIVEWWQGGVPADTEAGDASDPVTVVKALDAASNAGDLDGIMALFAENATLKDPLDGKVHSGKEWIRGWFQPQMGRFQVVTRNHRVAGDTLTWEGTLSGDLVKQMGSESIEQAAEAVVRDGKIISFAVTIVGRKP